MPLLAMTSQDSDRSETPDMSLGSLSLNATGEQLDDIQVNLERMYMESPAQNQLSGSEGLRMMPISTNNLTMKRLKPLQTTDAEDSFDNLSLLELSDVIDSIEEIDWLVHPPENLPPDFDEDDRAFLDTDLLYTRFSLLNFVTRVINEERYAHINRHVSPSRSSNLVNEAVGSGATIKITRPFIRSQLNSSGILQGATLTRNGRTAKSSDGNTSKYVLNPSISNDPDLDFSIQSRTNGGSNQTSPLMGRYRNNGVSPSRINYTRELSQDEYNDISSDEPPFVPDYNYARKHHAYKDEHQVGFAESKTITHRLSGANLDTSASRGRHAILVEANASDDRFASAYLADESSNDNNSFVLESEKLSPINSASPSRGLYKLQPRTSLNGRGIGDGDGPNYLRPNPEMGDLDDSSSHSGSFSREIDSRTYTRPKKSRMTIASPNRQLNTTMELSLHRQLNTTMELSPHRQLNATMEMPHNRHLNTTMELSPHRHHPHISEAALHKQLNTTIDLTPEHLKNNPQHSPKNLNETFVADDLETTFESASDRARRVTRNLSYVIRRDEESPNNNTTNISAKSELNSTFTYDMDGDGEPHVARESQNTSMEDLNSRVASQIRSLGCSSTPRGRLSDNSGNRGISHLEDTRLVARTSSTDTYSVAHSSESPTSSGLSSPMDAQSYDDIQSGEAVRRSMPNLAVMRTAPAVQSGLAFPQAGGGQLRKNHYISDSRLSRLGTSDRPKLSVLPTDGPHNNTFNRRHHETEANRSRPGDCNTSTPALNRPMTATPGRVYSAHTLGSNNSKSGRAEPQASRSQTSIANVRSTGLHLPRITNHGLAGSGLRPPRPAIKNPPVPGARIPTFRSQSRIPGPGLRFSRPPQSQVANRGLQPPRAPNSPKGSVDDWRDGCY